MLTVKKYSVKLLFLILIASMFLGCSNNIFDQKLEKHEKFNLFRYEIATIGNKFLFSISSLFDFGKEGLIDNDVVQYKKLTEKIHSIEKQKESITFTDSQTIIQLEKKITDLIKEREFILLRIETQIQKIVRDQIRIEGMDTKGFVFPPVFINVFTPPLLLVTSPRNEILRQKEILLETNMQDTRKSIIEQQMLEENNLSAVVLEIGGLASYPSMIKPHTNFERLFQLTAHEWLHQYLAFYPLGRSIFNNSEMTEINETLAGIFGKTIAAKICSGESELSEVYCENYNQLHSPNTTFDYDLFMRETRQTVDHLLTQNQILGAEKYMEERRIQLIKEGVFIRKINQAWFAFHGTYADSPTSVSPVFSILQKLEKKSANIKEFIDILKNLDNYDEFLKLNDY